MFTNDYEENIYTGVWIAFPPPGNGVSFNVGSAIPNNTGPPSRRSKISNRTIEIGEWTHIVGVMRGILDMDIYIGCRESEGNYSGNGGNLTYGNNPGNIGRYDFAGFQPSYFHGAIDDFRMYDRELTIDEITRLCGSSLSTEENTELPAEIVHNFTLFPNPTNNVINIATDYPNDYEVNIISADGKQVKNFQRYDDQIDVSELDNGTYIVVLTSKTDKLLNKKLKFVKT